MTAVEILEYKIDEIDKKIVIFNKRDISEVKVQRLLNKKAHYEQQLVELQG